MGTLYLVSTPIGNLDDITIRAVKTLFSVDYIACEDTRVTSHLLQLLKDKHKKTLLPDEVSSPALISYHESNEENIASVLIQHLQSNSSVALVSDAGTPLLNDPGFVLVRWAIKKNISVVSVPGPHAATTALIVSGLPANTYHFLGYPPEKELHFISLLRELEALSGTTRNLKPTYIFYCSPHKIRRNLEVVQKVLGNIHIVIARELTKVHEEIWRGKVTDELQKIDDPKGEFVLLFNLS